MVFYPLKVPLTHNPRFRILLVSATERKASGFAHDVLPLQCAGDKMCIAGDVECFAAIEYENKRGLPSLYNEVLKTRGADFDAVCFFHDDLIINDCFFYDKLEKALLEYDVVGIAGGKSYEVPLGFNPSVAPLGWWNASSDLAGSIVHQSQDGQCVTTTYGACPS